jgi:hypothetical protein
MCKGGNAGDRAKTLSMNAKLILLRKSAGIVFASFIFGQCQHLVSDLVFIVELLVILWHHIPSLNTASYVYNYNLRFSFFWRHVMERGTDIILQNNK